MSGPNPVTIANTTTNPIPSNPRDSSGNAIVAGNKPGTPYQADILFDATGDLPADMTAIASTDLITITGFGSGAQHCRITYHALEDLGIPFAIAARASINDASAAAAATNLSVVNNAKGDSVTAGSDGPQTVSKHNPIVEWDLQETSDQVDTVYVAGIAPDGTGAKNTLVTVEVW